MIKRSSTAHRLVLGAVLPALTVLALGCGSSSKPSSNSTNSSTTVAGATSTAAKAAATSDLSGAWSGHYSGSFSGTFNLTWQASGSNLSGTIKISSLGDQDIPINGSLQGDSIKFGTVGSTAITYTGSVSSGSMSGDWKIEADGKTAGNGSWSATKS